LPANVKARMKFILSGQPYREADDASNGPPLQMRMCQYFFIFLITIYLFVLSISLSADNFKDMGLLEIVGEGT